MIFASRLCLTTILLCSVATQFPFRCAARQPDVVIIMADDMGYSDLGCYGGEIRTPNLDRLAQGGIRFRNFYSENMCWVSRAAMLTGVYHTTSVRESAIHPSCMTLSEALRRQGYQTRMSGKWHLAGNPYHIFPADRGFDEFYGMLGGAASFFAPAFLTRNRENVDEEYRDADFYFTNAISQEADRMIRSADSDKPLFLYVAFNAAHWPLHALPEDIAAYSGTYSIGWDELRKQRLASMQSLGLVSQDVGLSPRHANVPAWETERHKDWQQRRMEVYAAQVTCMDRGIGQIVKALDDTGRLADTLLMFTVDNGGCHVEYAPDRTGDHLPEKTRDGREMRVGNLPDIMPGPEDTYQSYGHGWANASNTPYRLFKQYDHEGGIRTPMIAHWPKKILSPGRIVSAVSHLIDIMPTVLEVTQIDAEPTIPFDGRSFAATFEGETLEDQRTLFFHHNKGKALRQGTWKIVSAENAMWELYDLAHDSLELHDLSHELPLKLDELVAIWESESRRLQAQAH